MLTRSPSSSSRVPMLSGVTPNRQAMARTSSARMVIIRPLKSWRCTWIMLRNRRRRSRSGPLTVCSLVRSMATFSVPDAVSEARRADVVTISSVVPVDPHRVMVASSGGRSWSTGHVVQLGQALEPGHRDGPFAPLVGPEHGRLELLLGHGLHGLQGEAHLLAHGTEAGAYGPGVYDPGRFLLLVFVEHIDTFVNHRHLHLR